MSTEKGVKSLSERSIWEDFQVEETGNGKAQRRPGGFGKQPGCTGRTGRTNGRRKRTEGSRCHSG